MQSMVKFIGLVAAGAMLSVVVAGAGMSGEVHAAEDASSKESTQVTYSYVAQPGDAYTQLVRKAVQTYGLKHDMKLEVGKIVAIETRVSEQSGWPVLSDGQTVSFSEGLVKAWIDETEDMSEADVAAWATYAPYINFDTRHIGE